MYGIRAGDTIRRRCRDPTQPLGVHTANSAAKQRAMKSRPRNQKGNFTTGFSRPVIEQPDQWRLSDSGSPDGTSVSLVPLGAFFLSPSSPVDVGFAAVLEAPVVPFGFISEFNCIAQFSYKPRTTRRA